MTVVANWTDRSTALLKRAVQKVLDQNPFLCGKLIKNNEVRTVMTHPSFVLVKGSSYI